MLLCRFADRTCAKHGCGRHDGRLEVIPMRRTVVALLALFAAAVPVEAGLMEILEGMQMPKRPERLMPKLPPMPALLTREKNWVGTQLPRLGCPFW